MVFALHGRVCLKMKYLDDESFERLKPVSALPRKREHRLGARGYRLIAAR